MTRLLHLAGALALLAWLLAAPVAVAGDTVPPGPPYPPPIEGQVVYDTAGVFNPVTIERATETIRAIEGRTGAQVVVYTQVKPESDTPEEAADDAIALGEQWHVGRKGIDDGLVILYDLEPNLKHGQVQLTAGEGFRATFLTNEERQAIYENDMLPLLKEGDLGGALIVALQKVDAAATPENAARLRTARQINALLGFGGILVGIVLVVWWLWNWLLHGRDPDYLDDASIYMPAPPPNLTPAVGALVLDGRSSRHTLTTAMLDLGSHGELAFEEVPGLLRSKVAVRVHPVRRDDPKLDLVRRHPLGSAETLALGRLRALAAGTGHLEPDDLLKFGKDVPDFDKALESTAVEAGWFGRTPGSVIERWAWLGGAEIGAAVVTALLAVNLPSDGLMTAALAVGAAGLVTLFGARLMPAVTRKGAMVKAMLAAYRRTLKKTLELARSMTQVVESRVLPWLEVPDQAVVWGVALGLHREVQAVLARSLDDVREGRAAPGTWFPIWYLGSGGNAGGGARAGLAPGLMAGSAVPNFGGMLGAIGTIGNAPSSSGGGGGGGGGFGGGGAGGGF